MRAAYMMMALAACTGPGDALPPDAAHRDAALDAPPPPARACMATYAGNFAETDTFAANCASVAAGSGATALGVAVPALALGSDIAIQIALADPPALGAYSSESTATWSAMATEILGTSRCYYTAGDAAVPPGSFTMTLSSVDLAAGSAHGELAMTLAVLPGAETDCGSDNAELLSLVF